MQELATTLPHEITALPATLSHRWLQRSSRLVVLRFAEEFVPVNVIARALKIPSSEIWPVVNSAFETGILSAVPLADWPPARTASDRRFRGPAAAPLRLSDVLSVSDRLAGDLGLTNQEAVFLAVLLSKPGPATKPTLLRWITGDDPEVEAKIVDVVCCRVRAKLKKRFFGSDAILTVRGIGYAISPPARACLRKIATGEALAA